MLSAHGLPLAQERLTQAMSYGEMAGALLAGQMTADCPVDVLVFAFAVPDVAPWRATASYLSHLCPGQPMAFAVCDAGAGAPFVGLRLILEYASTGGCRRALLVAAEQAALPYQPPVPVATPARHAVVALLCDQSRSGGPEGAPPDGVQPTGVRLGTVRTYAGIAAAPACALLAEAAADLAARHDLTTVLGASLTASIAPGGLPGEVIIAPPEQPCTGVLWEVAGRLPGWAAPAGRVEQSGRDGRVLLADYDPQLDRLCLASIEIPGERR
jgi:4-hydroxymandelate oxidase